MRKNFKSYLILGIIILQSFNISSQILEPVKWSFSLKELPKDEVELIFTAKIEKNWHLYSQKLPETAIELPLIFEFSKNQNYKLIGLVLEPKGETKYDEEAKADVKSFSGIAIFKQKIKKLTSQAFKIEGSIDGQACQEGKCVGVKTDFSFSISGAKEKIDPQDIDTLNKDTLSTISEDTTKIANDKEVSKIDESPSDEKNIDNMTLIAFFLFAFVGGLVALLTPCIYPMIPMTVSYFMHSSKNRRKSIISVLVYGLSIIIIYVFVGTVVAVTLGEDFSNWLSTHWLPNIFFFIIFIIFAASFFGMFELTLPSWMINKTDKQADRGGYLGSFFMAFTLVLVSFSCTAPIVGSILAYSTQGQVLKPIVGMLGFSLAFAIPFSAFAFFPSALKKLPKSGGWLNSVKVVLGFIELALGLKFLSVADQTYHWGLLDRDVYLALWIVIFSLMGLYLIGKIKFAHDSDLKHLSVGRLILAIITFSFVIYLIPGMVGAPLKGLSGWLPPINSLSFDINTIVRENSNNNAKELCEQPKYSDKLHLPPGFVGYFELEQALRCSKEQKKPVFIDFTGHGCVNCREMENRVWVDKNVAKILKEDFIIVALYVDDKTINLPENEWYKSTYDGKIKKTMSDKNSDYQRTKYSANAQPFYVIVDSDGNKLLEPHAYNLNIDKFLEFLEKGKKEYQNKNK